MTPMKKLLLFALLLALVGGGYYYYRTLKGGPSGSLVAAELRSLRPA